MKRNSIYKKALVLAAVLTLALILLVGCGQTTSGDSNLNQFVKPDTGSQQQTETVKTALSGDAARQLLLTSIINAKTVEPNSRYITFSFAPYVYVEKEGKTDKYTVKVKGSIDTLGGRDDKQYPVNESVMTFEVLKESADLTTVVLGIYAKGGDMYIDFNDYETGKAVHRYYVSDSDIAYVVGLFKDILNQLKIEEVLTDYDLGSLINDAGVKNLISTILGTDSDDKLTLFNILLSLISESGSYSVTNADGSVDLVMPTKLNAIFTNKTLLEQVGNVVNGLLGGQSDIIKGVVNFLVGDILSGKKTLNTALVANISNNRFQKLALNVVSTKGGVDKTMELGIGGLSKSADFANEVKNSMPELVKTDRKNYSFTTLSADLNINLDIAEQKYSIENIDGAVGGAIAKALEGITGTEIYKKSDAIQILEPLQISLHLKLRAEINLKDNKKTRAVIELNGKDKKGNDRTYLGLYYIGADNALYADMSGLGGGKAMIPDINLNQILKDLIAAKIPEIPSIMEIIGGKGSGAASGDVINAGLIEAVQTAMDNGELVVTHYGLAAGDDDSAAVEETASLDIMALIGCLNIVKGDSTPLTVESISASLTKDVIAGLMGKLGMKLPIDQLDLKIYQTREDYEAGEEGWKIDVAVNMATEERGQILGANVGLFLNYGNPDPSLDGYLKGKEFKSAEEGGEYINAGKLTYKDGEFDFDLWVSIGLELELEFNVRENSVLDLSALGKLLYNLALKVQSPDGVNAKFNLKINANANVMALVNAIKNGADVAKILGAVDARIDITTGEGQNAKTAVLLLEDGMLYLNSSDGEFRNYKINILEALGGNFKLFGKDVSGTGSALASGEGDTTEGEGGDAPATEEKAKFDIVGLLLANINCISVNRDRLEVAIADTLITALLNGLGVDTEIVKGLNFSNSGTAISLEYDGLNLSKLWLKANVGIQQGDNAALGLGLGLGHIVLTVGKRNLAALGERNILEDEYQDLLNGGNVYLGLGAEIDVALDDETYVLEDLLGALVANFALGTTIDIKDEIKGGLTFNIVADIDISSKPDQNDSRILIEIRKKSNGKVFLGLYYDQKTTTLYLKTDDGTIIQPVALKFDLIGLLEGLINKGDGTASADIDLSELNPVILLSNKGLQIQVMTGVMKLLVGVLVGDMNDYIEYNAGATSYKYYAYDANTDYTILQNAYPLANPVGQKDLYQRNVDKYVYENGEFTLNNDYGEGDFFVKAKEGSFFYVLKDNATGIDEKYFEKNADGTLKEFANSGRNFTLIDASNKDIYASAPKYYQSEFKRADTLMFDMDKDVMEFTKGFIPAYNKTSGLTTYVKVDASRQEVALYEVFTQGYTMKDVFDENGKPTGETKRMELKLPELGASIVIGKIEDGDVSVVEGGTKFSGIGIGIFIMRNGQSDPHGVHYVKIAADETYTGTRYNLVDGTYQEAADGEYKQVANTAANVAIKLGNIQLSEKTFKENYGVTFEQFIDGLQNENLPQADATNIADLTVYVNVEAGIEIGAIKTAAGGDTWAIGGLLSGIVGGSDKDPSALANFLKSLLIKFNVQDEFKDVIGLRIAGNVNLGALLSGDTKDTMQIVKALLMKSDLAVELTDGYPWAATKTVVGLYVTEGTIYINIDGEKTIKDTKLKIGVDKVLGMVGGASTGALASADLGVEGILSIVNNIVKEISIYRNDEASGMTISLSKNMLGAILQLVADIDGVDLKLNETNSFIELNTKVTDKKPYLLKLSVGIDPLVLGIALGGLKIGLAANSDVLKNLIKADYKGLSEIETMALDVEIGVDLGLKQGEFPIGKLISGILQATGTDLEFPLNLDIQSELDLDLRVRLAGNLNLKEFGKSDLMLQVRNAAPGKEKTILGLYFTTEKDATGKDIPCLYVETQFFSQSAPVRSKVENFDLLGSLLGKTVSGVVEYLGGKVEGTGAALASDDGATTNEAEIILELASKSIQVKIAEETVKGLLEALVGDKVGDDIIEIINGLGLSAEVAVNLKDESKPLLSVVATCSYLDLGILVNKVNLSTQKQDIFGTTLSGNTWTKAEDAKKSALGVQFGVELNYDISNGKHSLDAILSNVASAAAFEKDATMATVGSILKAVSLDAIIKNTHGSIGIDVVLNVKSEKMTEYLVPAGQALYELIMGKLGAEYTAGEEKYDPLQLLNMVEALIKINLNGNPVFVSLKDGYVYVSLSAVGGDNFKASLQNIIDQIKKTSGSGSSALATGEGDGEKDNKKTDYVLVNKILQNLLSSASISDTGLDLALAPNLMNVLFENVVAKLLGDTFGFKHSGIGWTKDNGISIDLVFDNPNTTKTPDFSIGLGLDATLVLQGEAIEVIPYFVKKAGAKALDNQEVKGYFKEGTALVEIPVAEVYTGTRYDKDGNVDENGKFRKELVEGTEAEHDLVLIGNIFPEVSETVGDEKIYLSMELGLTLSGTKGTNDSILDFVADIIDVSNRTSTTMKYVEFAENEDKATYEGQRYSKTGAMSYAQDVNGTFKRGAYYLAETGYVGTKFVKNTDGTFTIDNANGTYKFVDSDSAKTYFPILPEETETYPADKKYREDGKGFVTDANGDFKAGEYSVTDRTKGGAKFRLNAKTGKYFVYEATGITLYKQGNYYEIDKDELATFKGVRFDYDSVNKVATVNASGKYQFVAEEGAYYPVLENDGYTGKLYRVSEASTPDNTIYIEDVIYKFTPAFTGKDLRDLNALAKLLVSIGEFEAEARIKVTVGANVAELVKALSNTANIDIAELLKHVELAIESLDSRGTVKGGIYLYNSTLYIKYINTSRGIFSMPVSELFGAIASASADERMPYEAAMLQLWVGEFIKLNGVYTTGIAVQATTSLVETLLETLLGFDKGTINLKAFGAVGVEVTIVTASPIFPENADGEVYVKKAYDFVALADGEVYDGEKYVLLENGEYGEIANGSEDKFSGQTLYKRVAKAEADVSYVKLSEAGILSECEGYDSAYAEALTTRYTKVNGIYEELKFGFDFDSFGIGIGLKIGHVGFNLNIGKIDIGLIDGTQSIVPDEVKNAPIAQETVIDLSLEVNLGLEFMDKNTNATTGFDIGKFVDNLGVLTGVTLGEDWLKLTVPEGGAEVRLSLRVALALNLTNVDHSVAAIEIVGQIFEGNEKIGEKTIIGVYYKDGNVLLKLDGLGFDNIRISGLRLSDLLGGSNGVEILKKLLGGSGSSSALASEVNFTVVGNDEFGSPAAALILDSNRIAVEVGTLFIEKLLGIAALGLDENTQKLLGGLNLKALVEVNFGEKFVTAEEGYTGTKYALDTETKKYYIDNDNGTFKRESNISLKLNAEAAELLGINVAVENIKIGNTGVEERVKAIDINDYVEFIEILFGTEKDENGNEIVDANGKPKKKIVGFEPKLEALTLSLDLDLGAMFTNGMAMGRSILDSEGKTVLTNVSSVGAIGNGNMGIRASVKLEIAFAALLNKLQQGFDSSDIFAAIEQALPLVKAQISLSAQSDGDELIGIYVADGNVYLMLNGLGMPNIKVTGEFLMDIIRTATGSGTALSSDEATASVETSQIIDIVKQIVDGISVGGKALKVAFQNDYFAKLVDALVSIVLNKEGFKYYQDVLPDVPTDVAFSGLTINLAGIEDKYEPIYRKDGKYYFDAGCTSQYYGMVFFKNTVTNHIELFSEKEYVKQFGEVNETTEFYRSIRNGLVELDLVAYSTHLKLAVNMPKLGAQKNIISSPEVAGVAFTEADEVTGVALGLKGQVKIDKQPGIALANILSGVVGDLETKLVIEEDIDIRFAIEAAVGIKYSLKDKNFALNAVDLRISLTRVDATLGNVPLAVLTYISSEGTLYVDVSHFFQKQNAGNNKNLGMLKITGVNVLDLINGLITGEGSATSVALGSSDAWVEDEQQPYTYVYYEANAINSAAPAKFVHVAQLNDKDEPRMVYRNYTGAISADYKTESGKDLYVRDRANKDTGYTLLSAENAEKFSHKAKYTHEQAMTYTKLTDLYVKVGEDYVLAAGDADVTATVLYQRVISNYVKIADGETVNAEDRYEQNADGTYTQNANGTFKAVYKFVKVSDGSAWYIEEYNSETCKYEYNVYDPANPDHNAPKLYHYDETEKKYAEGAGEGGAKSYVKVPVYSISAVWADLRNYGIADNVAGYDVASNAKVNITGKAMLGLIGGLMGNAGLEDILDALLVSVHATKDPFIFGADIGILDVYNDYKLALNVGLNIFGFDFEKREGAGNTDGSYLEFLDAENTISFKPENANSYRQFADVDLNRILSASEIMDVLVDSLDFGKSGKIYLNLSLDADSFAKDTGDNFVPWEKYFAALLGLNENSARVLYQVLFPEDELDGKGNFSIDIAAAIDVKKLLGGLIAGTGLNLEGTEIRITINSDTMLFSEDSRKDGSKIVITAIGEADGILSVFIDNSGYRGKGKHVAKLDLNAILGTATSSAAYASANENTGLIPENIFGVLNALLGEVRLGGGKISVVLRENFIGALLNTLVGTDITEQQSLVKGEIYIDLRNLEVGIEMILGDDNYVSEGERDFYIGLRIGGINLTAPDGFDMTEYTFIKKADRANFKNIKQLKLDINFESEWYYEATSETEGFDISPVVDILETILKKELFPDRLLQVLVKDDKIDAVYATAISAHIDLADFNNMKLSVEIFKSTSEEPVRELKLGVYLDGQSVYVDLSGWGLPKIKLGGLNLGNTINDALLPLLDQYLVGDDNKRGGETAALASSYVGDYDKNHIEYSDFVEAADGKYVLVYTESNSGGYVLVDGKYVKYNAKEHADATRYARKVEEYDMANTAHQNVTRYNVNKGAFRSSWGKVLFPVAYEEDENGGYVLIDGKYVPYNAEQHAGQKRYKEVSGNKPYISLLLANNRFGFGINADLINSLLETILGALNLDIQLPDFGDAVLLFDSRKDLNGDGYADMQLDLAVQVNDNLYFGFRTTNLEITGNSTEVSHAERRYAEVVGDGKEFVTVYDIEKGEIGLETVALGFNVQIRQNCVDNEQSDFEKYLGVLLKSLLGINNFTLNLPSSGEIGCDIDLRVSLNIANLVKALQGGNVDWWSDIELYLDLKPMGYGSLLTMYKQKGDADVYADLSGLSLFKVKIIGLQSLIGGLVSASATALASGDNEVAIASASGDIAKLTIIPGKVGFTIEIGWGFIEGLLTSLLGDTLHVADGTGELEGYKTITIGEGATATVIPLPKMNNDRALSLSINHASAMYNRSLEIDLRLGFNKNDESAVNLKIHNFVLTSGKEKSERYIRFGATAGNINEAGTGNGVLDAINGTNANAFSGLVLSDAKGISLVNILTSVIKGIDPDITIDWRKNTNHYYTDSKTESYNSNQNATIELSRTDKSSEHMDRGVKTYAGKFQAKINNDKGRLIGAWLFNNQLYIDITQTLDIPLAIGALRKMKVADLDILGLLGGLGAASATNAMASDEATTEKSLKDTVSGFVKGVQVNWWNNKSVAGNPVGDKAITTIRVDLNGKGLNNILAKVYYLLYGMYDTNAPAAELFSEEALYQMVYTEGQDVTLKDGTVVKSVNAHGKCVFYLQTFASNMIGEMASILKDMLKPGGSFGDVLREILGRLLPLPKLDEAENGRPSYVEIVIDKNRLASGKGVLKQIALTINKERTTNNGSTITAVGNNNDTAEIVINLDNNVTLRSVSAVRDYNTNSTKPNEDSGKTINVANPFDPVELTSAALNSSGLLDRVAADFYGISEYDSKSEKGVTDSYAELGGTPIVWDTSTAILEPGKESEIWGYALNYKVQKVKVKVSNSTGFLRLFGYFKADGTTFVETNKITVDPTKDPTGTDNISAGLPRIIVIMRRDGELQVLSRDYDKDKPGTVNINGTDYTVDGKFNWIDEDTVEEGATVEKLFWYQVGYSSRIQKSIKVKYNNVDIVSGSFPNVDKFGILNGDTAFDFTPENFDIVGNLGLPSIKASETFAKVGDKFSYVGFDGSTYLFAPDTAPTNETELAEWNKHTLGGKGTFTRSFNGKVLQSGTYTYVAAESAVAGLLDSLGGLFGGSGANTDNGKYDLTVTDTGYTGLKEITVKLGTGKTTTVDVIEWNYDDFKYDMRKPQNGASGRIVAVINKYEIKRTTGLVEKTEVVNSKQKIRLDVGITQESLSALAGGDLKFNQYEDAFVLSATGDYVLETRDAFIPYDETLHKDQKQYALVDGTYVDDLTLAAADNTARYVEGKVTGYVYDKYADGKSADNRYATNIFDAEELYVKVKHSSITSETQQFHVDDFKFYTDTFTATDTQTPFTMFVVPELGVKTERNITVKALYDVNGAYEQIFDIKVVVTPKVATKVVLLIDNDQVIDRTYLESTAEVTVYYKDGTEKQGLAKDLIRLTDKEIEKIANAKDHLGITYGTASVFKKGRYELIAAGETYDGQRFGLVDGNFVEATDGEYKFVEDETFVQNGVTFEIRVFSKN